ncbi:hypothetical protein ACHAWO_004149 [Cyclotella atomus]|uniref:Man1/Src1 C-terminal domain-containing protein n=1 Tax=Cyclotella atomus TaxID=382360 RepID=A0ABD3NT52_9STRA
MPKRKAIDDEQEEQTPTPKKPKTFAERQQEARQKAKAKIYKQTPETKNEEKSPVAKKVASASKTVKKRSRKSTGTDNDSSDTDHSHSSSRRRSTGTNTTTRRRGRSTAAAAAVGEFKFDPIPEEEPVVQVQTTGPNGTPIKSNEIDGTYQFSAGKSLEGKSKTPEEEASKKRQKEKRDRLREEMKKKRLSLGKTEVIRAAKEPEVVQLAPPSIPAAATIPAADMPKEPPATAPAAAATTLKEPPAASQPKQKSPPKAIAAIFAPQNKSKYYTAHRPNADKKFDPNQPFPTHDYVVPTAAYCGCGPTPALKKKKKKKGDLCLEPSGGDAIFGRKESFSKQLDNIPAVDPPYHSQRRDSCSVSEDEKESRRAVDPDGSVAAYRKSIQMNTEEELKESVARARGMISFVSDSNKKRRARIGIKSAAAEENVAVQLLRLLDGTNGGKEPEEVGASEDHVKDGAMEEDAEIVVGSTTVSDDEAKPSFVKKMWKRAIWVLFAAMMVQLAFGVYYVATNHVLSPSVTSNNETKSASLNQSKPVEEEKQHHCFIDHPADFFAPDENMDEQLCAGIFVPCPQWGRCHAGLLHDCDDAGNQFNGIKLFVPNQNLDGCIVTEQVLEIVASVKEALATMTVAQHCKIWNNGNGNVIPPSEEQSYPMFRMEKVIETMQTMLVNDEKSILNDDHMTIQLLMWLEPVDSSVLRFGSLSAEEGVIDAIGLANAISPNSLSWPLSCSIRIMAWEALVLSIGIFWYLAKFAWYYICNHPIISAVALVMSYFVHLFMKRKRRLARIRELYPQVLEAAYDLLAELDNSEGYAVLMLRDDIVRSMYPTNIAARNFLYNEVWPRVIAEIHSDNRVRKFRKEANGKSLEHWDLHIQSKRGRRLRKSLGSAPELPAIVKTEEEAPAGRDP